MKKMPSLVGLALVTVLSISCTLGQDEDLLGLPEYDIFGWDTEDDYKEKDQYTPLVTPEDQLRILCNQYDLQLNDVRLNCQNIRLVQKNLPIEHTIQKRQAEEPPVEGSGEPDANEEPQLYAEAPIPESEGDTNAEPPAEEQPAQDPPAEEGPVPEPPVEEGPVPEPPVEGEAAPEPPVEGEPVPEPPVEGGPAPEPPAEGEPAPEPPVEEGPVPEPPVKGEPAPEPPVEEGPVPEPPVGEPAPEPPVEEGPVPEPPAEGEPAPEPPVEGEPAPETPDQTSEDQDAAAAAEETKESPETPTDEESKIETPVLYGEETPEGQDPPTPNEETKAEEPPANEGTTIEAVLYDKDQDNASGATEPPVEQEATTTIVKKGRVLKPGEVEASKESDAINTDQGDAEKVHEHQSGNAVIDGPGADTLEGSDAAVSNMSPKANLKENSNTDLPKSGESSEDTLQARKDSKILIILLVAVVVIGCAAFAYNFIKKRKQKKSETSRSENGTSSGPQKVAAAPDAEQGTELKPLMRSTEEKPVVEYKDEKDNSKAVAAH